MVPFLFILSYQPVVEKVAVLSAVVVSVQDDVAIARVKLAVVFFLDLRLNSYFFKFDYQTFNVYSISDMIMRAYDHKIKKVLQSWHVPT